MEVTPFLPPEYTAEELRNSDIRTYSSKRVPIHPKELPSHALSG